MNNGKTQSVFIGFDNGFDMFSDLLANYDRDTAYKIAYDYLDLQAQLNNNWNTKAIAKNQEEYQFCCELYQATKNHKVAEE